VPWGWLRHEGGQIRHDHGLARHRLHLRNATSRQQCPEDHTRKTLVTVRLTMNPDVYTKLVLTAERRAMKMRSALAYSCSGRVNTTPPRRPRHVQNLRCKRTRAHSRAAKMLVVPSAPHPDECTVMAYCRNDASVDIQQIEAHVWDCPECCRKEPRSWATLALRGRSEYLSNTTQDTTWHWSVIIIHSTEYLVRPALPVCAPGEHDHICRHRRLSRL
jgi:hypothetical protein